MPTSLFSAGPTEYAPGGPILLDPLRQGGLQSTHRQVTSYEDGVPGNAFPTSDDFHTSGTNSTGTWNYVATSLHGSVGTLIDNTAVTGPFTRAKSLPAGQATDQLYTCIGLFGWNAKPLVFQAIMNHRSPGAVRSAEIGFTTAGNLRVRNASGTLVGSDSVTDVIAGMQAGQKYYAQLHSSNAAGIVEARLYDGNGQLLESFGFGTHTGLLPDSFQIGQLTNAQVAQQAGIDWVGFDLSSWLEPPVITVDARPVSTITSLGAVGSSSGVDKVAVASVATQLGLTDSIIRNLARAVGTITSLGLASQSSGIDKVAKASAAGQLGLASSTVAAHRAPVSTANRLGLASTGSAAKRGVAAAQTQVGTSSTSSVKKVGKVVTSTPVGLASSAGAGKRVGVSALAALGLSDVITRTAGRAVSVITSLGMSGSSTGLKKVAKASASTPVGLSSQAVARKVGVARTSGALGLSASSGAAKRATVAVQAALGLSSAGTGLKKVARASALSALGLVDAISRTAARAVSVITSLGASSTSTGVRKVARVTTSTPVGLQSAVVARKVSPAAAVAALGLLSSSTGVRKVGKAAAVGSLGLAAIPVVRKVAPGGSRGCLGITSSPLAAKRAPALTRTALGLTSSRNIPVFASVDFTALGLASRWDVQLMMAAPWAIGLDLRTEVAAPTMGTLVLGIMLEQATGDPK